MVPHNDPTVVAHQRRELNSSSRMCSLEFEQALVFRYSQRFLRAMRRCKPKRLKNVLYEVAAPRHLPLLQIFNWRLFQTRAIQLRKGTADQ